MTRLIDADKLIRCLRNDPLFKFVEQFGITGVIDAQPTVDAEPVIRCKDCKNYCEWENGTGSCDRSENEWNWFGVDSTDYCSFAERIEE